MNIAVWLLALVPNLISQVLLALGLSVVTITGVSVVLNAVKQQLIDHFNALPHDILEVFLLCGGGTALGMIFGAYTTRLVMRGIGSSLRFFGANSG